MPNRSLRSDPIQGDTGGALPPNEAGPCERKNRFELLIRPLIAPGFRLAFGILQSREEAEDAVQEAALKAWRRFDSLQDQQAVSSWFLTIVTKQCLSVRRGRWWSVLKFGDAPSLRDDPEQRTIANIELRHALLRLDRRERLVVILRLHLDLPYTEVATILGTSELAARSRLHRALRRLRLDLSTLEVVS